MHPAPALVFFPGQAAVEQRKPVYISIPSDFAAMQARLPKS